MYGAPRPPAPAVIQGKCIKGKGYNLRCSVNHAIEMFMDRTVSLLTLVSGLLPLPDPRQLVACFCCSRSRWGGRSTGMGWVGFPGGFPSSERLLLRPPHQPARLGRRLDAWGLGQSPQSNAPPSWRSPDSVSWVKWREHFWATACHCVFPLALPTHRSGKGLWP